MQPTERGTKTETSNVDGPREENVDVIREIIISWVRILVFFVSDALTVTCCVIQLEQTVQHLSEKDPLATESAIEKLRTGHGKSLLVRTQPSNGTGVLLEVEIPKLEQIMQRVREDRELNGATRSRNGEVGSPNSGGHGEEFR